MTDNSVVFGAILIIWVGIFLYLVALDRKLSRIRREMNRHEG